MLMPAEAIATGSALAHQDEPADLSPLVDPIHTERMIPIRPGDLTRRLLDKPGLGSEERLQLKRFGELLAAVFHHEFHGWLQSLKGAYAPLDPDSDCIPARDDPTVSSEEQVRSFLPKFEDALIRANYRPLSLDVIEEAVAMPNEHGLNYVPDFDLFEEMRVYVRGETEVTRAVRRLHRGFRQQIFRFPAYQRLVIALKFREGLDLDAYIRSDVLYLRLFKDVPHVNMEMHLPEQGTKVVMRPIDRAQIISPIIVGLPSFAMKLLSATFMNPFAVGAVMAVPISAGLKSFFGFQHTRRKHLHRMIRNLYYLTLANNASVIRNIIDAAEEEEYKEALLAYYYLWRNRDDPEPWDHARLDARVEAFIHETTGQEVDFEIGDALDKLLRLGLLKGDNLQRLRAVPIEEALRILDERWDNVFQYHQP